MRLIVGLSPFFIVTALPDDDIIWVHVPRTGLALGTAIVHHMCPHVPKDRSILEWFEDGRKDEWQRWQCNGILRNGKARNFLDGSSFSTPLDDQVYFQYQGRLIAMFRNPSERLVSGYHARAGWNQKRKPKDMSEYVLSTQGCTTKMLVGKECDDSVLTEKELQKASTRLREGFLFFGITEEWALSMCLFNAMLETKCDPEQFLITKASHRQHSTDELGDFYDKVDWALHNVAVEVFERTLKEYGITRANCFNGCPSKNIIKKMKKIREAEMLQGQLAPPMPLPHLPPPGVQGGQQMPPYPMYQTSLSPQQLMMPMQQMQDGNHIPQQFTQHAYPLLQQGYPVQPGLGQFQLQ